MGIFSTKGFFGQLFSRGNNKYISQPNFYHRELSFDKNEDWVSVNGEEERLYTTTAELKIVIDRLGLMFSNGIWIEKDKEGNVVENSEAVKLLNKPNIHQSGKEFLFQAWIQRCIYANIFEYNHKGSNQQEIPSALWNLTPSHIVINRTGKIWMANSMDEVISSYTFKNNKIDETFKTDDVIQYSIPNPDDPILGKSPLIALKMDISNLRLGKGYSNVILNKKGPIGVWSSEAKDANGTISLDTKEELALSKQLTKTYGLSDEQAGVMIASNPMRFTSSSYPVKEMMIFETIDAGKKAIIDTYGANDNMFSRGAQGKGDTFTNVDSGDKICYQNTIIPFANDYAQSKASKWGITDKGHTLELNYDHIQALQDKVKENAETNKIKAETFKTLTGEGSSITTDEARDFSGI